MNFGNCDLFFNLQYSLKCGISSITIIACMKAAQKKKKTPNILYLYKMKTV